MRKLWKRLVPWLLLVLVAGGLAWAFWPRPVEVDLARVTRGPLRVTVDEDGETRVRERYEISSPLTGRLLRIDLDAGDPVEAGQTVLARIEPVDPSLLDPREVTEARARVRMAEATVSRSSPEVDRAEAALAYARQQLDRLRTATGGSAASPIELDEAETAVRMRTAELESAHSALDVAKFELELAQAALLRTEPGSGADEPFVIVSPINGRVFRLIRESASVVAPGEPILEIGDPRDLEVVADVLSQDAVRIKPGDRVLLERWGGDTPIEARVRLVEPSGFLKISALGVEEQRVNVIIDFASPDGPPPVLGDAYRVDASIIVWERPDVLQVPSGALFRHEGEWAVFVVDDLDAATGRGTATLHTVRIGERNQDAFQILEGLTEHQTVILHPSDKIASASSIKRRATTIE